MKLSSGLKAIEPSQKSRTYSSFYSNLRAVKKGMREVSLGKQSNPGAASTVAGAKTDLTRSKQKRVARLITAIEKGEQVGSTMQNRESMRVLGGLGFLRQKLTGHPGSALRVANRLNRFDQEHSQGESEKVSLEDARRAYQEKKALEEQEKLRTRRMQARARKDRFEAERKEEKKIHQKKSAGQRGKNGFVYSSMIHESEGDSESSEHGSARDESGEKK